MPDRIAVVGDVHGEATKLKALIDLIHKEYGYDIDIHQTGDLIDRGPDSKTVIQICIDEDVKAQMGNHEQYMEDLLVFNKATPNIFGGMMASDTTFLSYGVDVYDNLEGKNNLTTLFKRFLDAIPESHKQYFLTLEKHKVVFAGDEKFYLIHCGINDGTFRTAEKSYLEKNQHLGTSNIEERVIEHIAKVSGDVLLWGYPEPEKLYKFTDGVQIFGHRSFPDVVIKDHYIAVDTGCGYNKRKLSAVILPDRKVLSV